MSAPAAQRAFFKGLKARAFERVYFLFGDDDFLKDDAVRQLVAAAVEPSTRDFNLETRRAAELDREALEMLLGTPPMMAERRVVIIRDVGALKKDARGMLDRYLEHPAADTVLVLQSPAGGKAEKALEKKALAVEFSQLTGERVPKWIAHQATTMLGMSITPGAIDLLETAVGSDLAALAAELDKLASYVRGRADAASATAIDEHAVSDVVGVRRGETLGDLLDAVAERDTARALGLVPHILQQPKTTAVSVVMALAVQTLAMAWGRAGRARGAGAREGEYFALLKETGAFPMRSWGDAARCWSRNAARWSSSELDAALELLLAADRALKESRLSSEEQMLATLVLQLGGLGAARGGSRVA